MGVTAISPPPTIGMPSILATNSSPSSTRRKVTLAPARSRSGGCSSRGDCPFTVAGAAWSGPFRRARRCPTFTVGTTSTPRKSIDPSGRVRPLPRLVSTRISVCSGAAAGVPAATRNAPVVPGLSRSNSATRPISSILIPCTMPRSVSACRTASGPITDGSESSASQRTSISSGSIQKGGRTDSSPASSRM